MVPHVAARKARQRLLEFSFDTPKRLLQQYRPIPEVGLWPSGTTWPGSLWPSGTTWPGNGRSFSRSDASRITASVRDDVIDFAARNTDIHQLAVA